jgi:Icc-related predicted phosphoesterase
MKIVCISDTHEQEEKILLPPGDVLVHAGDITYRGDIGKLSKFLRWMSAQNFQSKIIISGNHDWCFQNNSRNIALRLCEENEITYLQDSGVKIGGINFWGSPWQPWFHNWAFNAMRGKDIAHHWAKIPEDTNVLITHGPVMNVLDAAPRGVADVEHVGCEELAKRITELPNLKAHICGHIHYGYGKMQLANVQFVNASCCTEAYAPTNPPITIEV